MPNCVSAFLNVGQGWVLLPLLRRSLKAVLETPVVLPHVLEFVASGGDLIASFPKLVHDFGVDFRFRPQLLRVDAPAASIYDDDEMLCSSLRQDNTEIEEVAIR